MKTMKLRTIRKSSSSYFDVLQKTQILALKLDSALIDVILALLVIRFDASYLLCVGVLVLENVSYMSE